MAAYTGVEIGLEPGTHAGHDPDNGALLTGAELAFDGGPAPVIDRLGPRLLDFTSGPMAGQVNGNSEGALLARLLAIEAPATLGAHLAALGASYGGVAFELSAFYRSADRLTIAGYARDLAGNPLRQFQLQFIGETVQDHTFGSATNLDGVYVAFLDVGDTYTAFAFSPTSGITYRLESMEETPNQTNLSFRQITRRLAGDGVFLRSGG